MKIGIMTFWWSNDNYGQLLQCYALQKYLRDAGHDAYLIRYTPIVDGTSFTPLYKKLVKALNPICLFRHINSKIRARKIAAERRNHDRGFSNFRERHIVQSEKIYGSYQELKENPPEADCYIVGSDQVWNFSFYGSDLKYKLPVIHAYFLDFGSPDVKRMSYAASWSVDSLDRQLVTEIEPLLSKFDFVSVREKHGIELCRQCSYEYGEHVCDPTLLLEADVYRKLYQNENIQKQEQKYLFLYMLNNQYDFDTQKVYTFAAEKQLKVVYVTGNGVLDEREKCFATIPEWLSLVDNAEYVITNSFHCCVFSILFRKQFGVVSLQGKLSGMNTRMESLFNQVKIEPRWLQGDFSMLDTEYKPCSVKESQKFLELLNNNH